jgi:DNA-binding MarR family transcriptional regulator
MEFDKIIHEPARLRIMMILTSVEQADFNFLLTTLNLTRGNLSKHVEKLEAAGYIEVKKSFNGKIPNTSYQITQEGSKALAQYWENLDAVRKAPIPPTQDS